MIQDGEKVGLVVTGGGSRGAYQVGVLRAVKDIVKAKKSPFQLISGVSVGALNAAALASRAENYPASVAALELFWRGLNTKDVFDPRLRKIFATGFKLALASLMPKRIAVPPKSLLNNTPLRKSLEANIDFAAIASAVDTGILHGISVTASGYDSGYAVTFFDTLTPEKEWHRVRREGKRCRITLDTIMASSALPLLFPAVNIEDQFYGDGALRQTSPLAPAIQLGADKLFVIGTRDSTPEPHAGDDILDEYPSVGDISGYALDIIFHDSLEADIERLHRINELVSFLSPAEKKQTAFKNIDVFCISPSKSLREVAQEHAPEMPRRLRWLLRRKSADRTVGRIESYLLFEPGYIGALIDLGYADAMARRGEIEAFFGEG